MYTMWFFTIFFCSIINFLLRIKAGFHFQKVFVKNTRRKQLLLCSYIINIINNYWLKIKELTMKHSEAEVFLLTWCKHYKCVCFLCSVPKNIFLKWKPALKITFSSNEYIRHKSSTKENIYFSGFPWVLIYEENQDGLVTLARLKNSVLYDFKTWF